MRSVVLHGILALAGLLLAWRVWVTPEEERSADAVELVGCDPAALESLELEAEGRTVTLARRGSGDERTWWVRVSRTPEEGEATTREFVASTERLEEYLPKVAPLVAVRTLGQLDEDTAGQVGLGDDAGTLVYRCRGRETTFRLGSSAFGTADRYVQGSGGATHLLAAEALHDLQSAESLLMQRDLESFERSEVEELVVRVGDRERRLRQRNRRDPRRAEWVDAAEPDRRNELYGNWLDRVAQLRVQQYLEPDAAPGSDAEGESVAPVEVLRIEYFGERGATLGTLELARVDTQPLRFYAKTNATRAWVTLPRSVAEQVEDDARSMLGLEPAERPEPPAPPAPPPAPQPEGDAGAESPQDAPPPGPRAHPAHP